MKYILVTKCGEHVDEYKNRIYRLSDESKPTDPDILVYLLKEVFALSEKVKDKIPFRTDVGEEWKDVTMVYRKIHTLLYIKNREDVEIIKDIIKRFEEGQYPTKTEFKYMNLLNTNE